MTENEFYDILKTHYEISEKIYTEAASFEANCRHCFLEFFNKFTDLMREYPESVQRQMWNYYLNDVTINGELVSVFAKSMMRERYLTLCIESHTTKREDL